MRLSTFSVVNYRSITNARKIQTSNMTVLVEKTTKESLIFYVHLLWQWT